MQQVFFTKTIIHQVTVQIAQVAKGHNFLKTALQMHSQESHSPIQKAYQYNNNKVFWKLVRTWLVSETSYRVKPEAEKGVETRAIPQNRLR